MQKWMVSNPDISYALKLSLPTTTQITKELIERGLVKERGEMESTEEEEPKHWLCLKMLGKR